MSHQPSTRIHHDFTTCLSRVSKKTLHTSGPTCASASACTRAHTQTLQNMVCLQDHKHDCCKIKYTVKKDHDLVVSVFNMVDNDNSREIDEGGS